MQGYRLKVLMVFGVLVVLQSLTGCKRPDINHLIIIPTPVHSTGGTASADGGYEMHYVIRPKTIVTWEMPGPAPSTMPAFYVHFLHGSPCNSSSVAVPVNGYPDDYFYPSSSQTLGNTTMDTVKCTVVDKFQSTNSFDYEILTQLPPPPGHKSTNINATPCKGCILQTEPGS